MVCVADLGEIANIGPHGSLVLLKAYLDESRHTDGPVCFVAGWVGRESDWQSLETEWIEKLKPRKALHLKKLRWNTNQHRIKSLLDRMGPIPERHGLVRVASSMRYKDYQDLAVGTPAELVLRPYASCVMGCLTAILKGMSATQDVHVFFERQDAYEAHIEVLSHSVFEDRRVRGMTYLQKDQSVCFQPADFLAFHLSSVAVDKDSPQAVLSKPIYGRSGVGFGWTRAKIKEHVSAITASVVSSRRAAAAALKK